MSGREDAPIYRTITIAGVGLIGGSLALALKRAGHPGTIIGISRRSSIDEARRLGAIDEGLPYDEIVEAASRSDLVVLASPISRILEHLEVLGGAGERLRPGTVITDVGSTKASILHAASSTLPESVHFIGGHPLAGSEQRGIGAADPFLFQNAYYVLTPAEGTPAAETSRMTSLIGRTGARAVLLDAEEHDRIAAAISHLPQILAVTLVNSLEDLGASRETAIHLAAGGFRDMTRIASSSFEVWRDILATNRNAVLAALERFRHRLEEDVGSMEEGRLDALFDRAASTRREIPRDTKGFLTRLWDVLVEVEDTPGTIFRLAEPLAAKAINIKDIEVLKVREGEGGTLRLAFATEDLARRAVEEVRRTGFRARLRE